jgi:hypothetical protein
MPFAIDAIARNHAGKKADRWPARRPKTAAVQCRRTGRSRGMSRIVRRPNIIALGSRSRPRRASCSFSGCRQLIRRRAGTGGLIAAADRVCEVRAIEAMVTPQYRTVGRVCSGY